jgi:hypothetical protein
VVDALLPVSTRISQGDALKVQSDAAALDDVIIWTIYRRPTDYPRQYVARPHSVRQGSPFLVHLLANTLEEIRAMIPPHLAQFDRDPSDDIPIVEIWI